MADDLPLLIFALDGRRLAVPLPIVERVEPAVAVTPLPNAPAVILGTINWRGRLIAVYDCRGRFGLPSRDMLLSDRLILAGLRKRMVALAVDAVEGVVACAADAVVHGGGDLPQIPYIGGLAKLADGTVLIHDVESFLSLDEESGLAGALAEAEAG